MGRGDTGTPSRWRPPAARPRRTIWRVAGLVVASTIARGWLVALAIFGAGLAEREAGLSAAVLAIVLFTVYFTAQIFVRPFATGGAR